MDIRVRRALLPAVLAAALLLLVGWHAVPARAVSIDPELVAESVSEDGYYVDSSASYLKSDADLDKLRAAIEGAGRAGVVVLPAGTSTAPVISRLLQEPNRTYLVLSGARLQAVSNNMSGTKVNGLLAKAKKAGSPSSEVLTFLDLMSGKHPAAAGVRRTPGSTPSASSSSAAGGVTDSVSAAPVASAKKDSGGNGMLYGIVGVVIVLVLAAGGFFLWRRKKGTGPAAPPAF